MALPTASDNKFTKLIGSEGAAPATPAAATAILYVKADGLWYSKDDAGVETLVSGGSGMSNPMTTQGDVIYGGASGTPTRLAIGTATQVLTVNAGATAPEWAAAAGGGGLTRAYEGYNTIGASWDAFVADRHYAKSITLANDCFIASIDAHIRVTADAARDIAAFIATDVTGTPTALIAGGGIDSTDLTLHSAPGGRWFQIGIGTPWLTAGTYWFGVVSQSGSVLEIAMDTSGGADRYWGGATGMLRDPGTVTDDTPNRRSIRVHTFR